MGPTTNCARGYQSVSLYCLLRLLNHIPFFYIPVYFFSFFFSEIFFFDFFFAFWIYYYYTKAAQNKTKTLQAKILIKTKIVNKLRWWWFLAMAFLSTTIFVREFIFLGEFGMNTSNAIWEMKLLPSCHHAVAWKQCHENFI